jgi:hypothetical protein
MEQEDQDISAQLLANLARQQYAYSFGGGTIGGDIWNWREPSYMERLSGRTAPVAELKPELRGRVNVTPAGRGAAQELQGMREAGGRPYVEAPELFKRGKGTSQKDRADMFYSTVTGRPMGTMMGMGKYGGFGPATNTDQRSWTNYTGSRPIAGRNYENSPVWGEGGTGIPERKGPRNPEYGSNPEKIAKAKTRKEMEEDVMGYTGSPMEFTQFGEAVGMRPSPISIATPPPFPEMPDYSSLTGFGGYLTFPYANY